MKKYLLLILIFYYFVSPVLSQKEIKVSLGISALNEYSLNTYDKVDDQREILGYINYALLGTLSGHYSIAKRLNIMGSMGVGFTNSRSYWQIEDFETYQKLFNGNSNFDSPTYSKEYKSIYYDYLIGLSYDLNYKRLYLVPSIQAGYSFCTDCDETYLKYGTEEYLLYKPIFTDRFIYQASITGIIYFWENIGLFGSVGYGRSNLEIGVIWKNK